MKRCTILAGFLCLGFGVLAGCDQPPEEKNGKAAQVPEVIEAGDYVPRADEAAAENLPGASDSLEVVVNMDINPGNVAVAQNGRIFATIHQFRRAPFELVEIKADGSYVPYPDEAWNTEPEDGDRTDVFNALLGITADDNGRLWVIDNGNLPDNPQPPRLLAFDLETGELAYRYEFPASTGPVESFLQDLAVDDRRGFVYLADTGNQHDPALVVVDTNTNTSRRITGHPSFMPEDVDLMVEGQVLTRSRGEGQEPVPARIGINPITLSADGEILFYGAMNGTRWWSMPTRLLRENAPDETIFRMIALVGPKPVSDGAVTDAEGYHYFTAVNQNAIQRLSRDGVLTTLIEDPRLLWPDNLAIGPDGWLYVSVNQLHRSPFFNDGEERAVPPFQIMRMRISGIPGRQAQ